MKTALRLALTAVILLLVGSGALLFKYHRIVDASPPVSMPNQPARGELGQWVNPLVGTGGYPWVCGNNFPGAMVPFGMVRLGPETISSILHQRALNTSGYYYSDDQILGFSHTRLNGTGATDGGHFLVTPALVALNPRTLGRSPRISFTHREETASPGYYAVRLPKLDTLVELTATPRVGVHRYTFPQSSTPHLRFDVMNALGGRRSTEGKLRMLPEAAELEGSARTFGTFAARYGGIKVYFVGKVNVPWADFTLWQDATVFPGKIEADGNHIGVDLSFAATNRPPPVTLKLAISYVSVENARANLNAETADKDFDQIRAQAQNAWEEKLSSIRIQGGTEAQRKIFYTALFRVFQMPTVFNDANGDYLGFDRHVHRVSDFQYFTDLSLWDTFRTTHPLYVLIANREQRDMLVSLVKMLEQGGWLPRWPAGCGYSNSMLGTPADVVIADSYLKGIQDFDVEKAYQAMRSTALGPTPPGAAFSGRQGISEYLQHGYCPAGLVKRSISRTLEFAWADHAIARLAAKLGHDQDAALFGKHAQFYRNVWNPKNQFFQPRDAAGNFVEPFKPLLLTYLDWKDKYTQDYVEGSAMQWRWAVPFDAEGLISLFRDRTYFVSELDRFFAKSTTTMGAWNPGPYYWHGNQPDINAAYLFNEAGRPDLTQKWARWILEHKYGTSYDGIDGNDDAGTLSAWYVLSALGIYPEAGSDRYQLGTPLFEKAEVKLAGGILDIIADNYSPNHPYVRQVWLNDRLLNRWWIRHAEIASGGTLRFHMSSEPVQN
jgi:predicted alpha-1,2-mannosidase